MVGVFYVTMFVGVVVFFGVVVVEDVFGAYVRSPRGFFAASRVGGSG